VTFAYSEVPPRALAEDVDLGAPTPAVLAAVQRYASEVNPEQTTAILRDFLASPPG
jgi:hypothetical protein